MRKEKDYLEKAKDFEKKARIEIHHHRSRVPELYETAADNWIKEVHSAIMKKEQKKRYLGFAKQDYEHAFDEYEYQLKNKGLEISEEEKIFKKQERLRNKLNKLEGVLKEFEENKNKPYKLFAIFSIISFVFALVFVSSNLTGFVTSSNNINDFNLLGVLFFVSGLVFTFFYFRGRRE